MILLIGVVLLVLLVGVAVVSGATGLAGGDGRRGEGSGFGAAIAIPAAVAAAVVVLLLVMVLGLGGARSARGSGPETPAPDERAEATDDLDPVAVEGPPATFDRQVSVVQGASPMRPLPIVGGVTAGDVVDVQGVGFLEHAEGVVAQCASVRARVCRNVATVLTDGRGRLRVPYRLEGSASGDVLVVEVDLARGAARLAFGTTPTSRAVLSVTDGSMASIRGASPGERVTVRRCRLDADTVEDCSIASTVTVAADGTATAPLDVASGHGGLLTLVDAAGNGLAEPVPIDGVRRERLEVDRDPGRLLTGFAVALLLLGVAIALIRTTDWRVPAEAATPFLDAAPLEP